MSTNTNNTSDIRVSADRIDHSGSVIQGLKREIDGHRVALQAHWQGVSSNTFGKVMGVYDEELKNVLTSLENIHEKLVHSGIKYDSTEQEQGEAVSAIEAALNASV